jgi:hypothetical protein
MGLIGNYFCQENNMRHEDLEFEAWDNASTKHNTLNPTTEQVQEEYQELLPIAREMKNTPQPNGNANRDSDIDDAIAAMESFLNDWTDWKALAKAIAPNPVSSGGLFMASTNTTEKSVEEYEKWDATDSKQAAELSVQAI